VNGLFESGYWTLGRIRGVPVRLHWTLPLGALIFGRFQIVPGFWLGFFVLVLVHELGHAFLVKRRGLHTFEVRIHGLGGVCMHERGTHYDQAIIAWGGVLAQAVVLLVPALLVQAFVPLPPSAFLLELLYALTFTNLLLIAFNLLPFGGLDGVMAWKLPRLWRQRRGGRRAKRSRTTKGKAASPLRVVHSDPRATAKDIARKALEDARRR
jgi:Zn-dependent protease